jgi:uncharacterized protein with HEPN domain
MHEAAANAIAFTNGISKGDFLADERTKAAVAMMLIVLGEAAARIDRHSPEFVTQHPDWPWHKLRGIRNRGAHAYDTFNFDVIWDALTSYMPGLMEQLKALGNLDPRVGRDTPDA